MDQPVRWKQRFDNFEKAYKQLEAIIRLGQLDDIEKMALIKAFEFTFELAWKTLKDFLTEEGFELQSPNKTIRQAFQSKYIQDGAVWMKALKKRNETTHTYNQVIMESTVEFIVNEFFPAARDWLFKFKKEYGP